MAADTQLAGCSTMSCIVWLMLGEWPHDITQKDARQNNGRSTKCRFVEYVTKNPLLQACEPPQRFDLTHTNVVRFGVGVPLKQTFCAIESNSSADVSM